MPPKNIDISTLSKDGKIIVEVMEKRFNEMKVEMETMKSEFSDLLKKKNEEIIALNQQVDSLKDRVIKLENSIDDEDAYVRRDTVIFSGNCIPESSQGEICSNIIQEIVQDKLKIRLKSEDISVAHRLGKKPINQGPDRRGIIVKLCRRETKSELFMAKRNLPRTSSISLYINESLTPKRNTILFALRQMKKAHPNIISGCSSYDGRIYAYTKPSPNASAFRGANSSTPRNVRHLINTHASLIDFCHQFIKKPLDQFLNSWNH